MKFVVECFGCRSNQAEVQEWIIGLERLGYERTTSAAEAAFGIVNTCSVTEKAEKDVLRFVARAYRHTGIKWLVAGCTVSRERSALERKYSDYFFLTTARKSGWWRRPASSSPWTAAWFTTRPSARASS